MEATAIGATTAKARTPTRTPPDGPLGLADPAAEGQVGGDDDADPDQPDGHQPDADAAEHLRVHREAEQRLTVDAGVDAEGQQRGEEEAEDRQAGDVATGGDQTDAGEDRAERW